MSTFGLLVIILFMLLTGGAVLMYFNDNQDLLISKFLMLLLVLLVFAEGVLAVIEFPLYVVDGIIFISMGEEWLAHVMMIIYAIIIAFILFFIVPKINWSSLLTASPVKLVVIGAVLISLLAYTELFNGFYSFESVKDYNEFKEAYSEYDDNFFPTKILKTSDEDEGHYSVYPFDVTCASGSLDLAYRAEIAVIGTPDEETGVVETQMYFYPFTYKMYEERDPVAFSDATYDPHAEEIPITSATDPKLAENKKTSDSDAQEAA